MARVYTVKQPVIAVCTRLHLQLPCTLPSAAGARPRAQSAIHDLQASRLGVARHQNPCKQGVSETGYVQHSPTTPKAVRQTGSPAHLPCSRGYNINMFMTRHPSGGLQHSPTSPNVAGNRSLRPVAYTVFFAAVFRAKVLASVAVSELSHGAKGKSQSCSCSASRFASR